MASQLLGATTTPTNSDDIIATDRSYWDRHAKNYDLSMRLFGGPLPQMLERVARDVAGAEDVLELAAGTGIATLAIARSAKHVVATDYSPQMVEQLRARMTAESLRNVEMARADIAALEYPDGRFDVVVAANVPHLVPDIQVALDSMARVLRPGGLLVVPTYCHGQTWTAQAASRVLGLTGFPGRRRLTLAALADAVRGAGLRVTETDLLPGVLPIGFVSARR